MNKIIEDLGDRIHTNMKKKEGEYLQVQTLFVKRKELELRELVNKLNARKVTNLTQDDIILNLRTTIQSLHHEIVNRENEKVLLNKQITQLTSLTQTTRDEADFLQNQYGEQKRLNQILKLAINRLTSEMTEKNNLIKLHDLSLLQPTFLTQNANRNESKENEQQSVLKSDDYSDIVSQHTSLKAN